MIDEMLTMIPGPTPVHPRILKALGRPTVSHLAPELVRAYSEALSDFRTLCRSERGHSVVVAGGGTLAMEMALVNLVAVDQPLLVISQGYFGERFAELAGAFGHRCEVLRAEWGRAVPAEALARTLASRRFSAVTITHVDTSTGTCAPVADYCEMLRGREELIVLDGVCATGGIDEPFDEWGIDALVTAPQKAIGAPPGLAMCLFSERALVRRRALPAVPAYYADVLRWLPVMEDPGTYFSTACVNEIVALAEALRIVHDEGLEARFERHRRIAAAFRAGLAAVGLEPFTDRSALADTLSVMLYPRGVDDTAFRREMVRRNVVVAGGLGPAVGKTFRLGHMGNIGAAEVAVTLEAVEGSLATLGVSLEPGAALAAAAPHLAGSD